MPATVLFLLPLVPNTPSPTATLTTFISRKHPTTVTFLPPYSLDHRLFFETSSLLTSHPRSRRYVQLLTLSDLPGRSFVGVSAPTTPDGANTTTKPMTLVTLRPGAPVEELFAMISRKMEPYWALRSRVKVENGAAFELGGGDWRVRLGDVRVVAGQAQGRVRLTIAEVQYCGEEGVGEDGEEADAMFKSFWESLTRGSGVGMEGLRFVGKPQAEGKGETEGIRLVRMYMEILRFARA